MAIAQREVTVRSFADGAPREDDELWRMLLKLAHSVARRRGLTQEDAEDCAAEFAERMLRRPECAARTGPDGRCFPAWLYHCAVNHTTDFCRAQVRRAKREQPWPETAPDDGPPLALEFASDSPTPEAQLLRQEFWERMNTALDRLPPLMRELLVRHHLHGECVRELAEYCGRSSEAVELVLFRARRRMRGMLLRMGLSETELRAYIVLSRPLQDRCLCYPCGGGQARPYIP